VFRDPYGFISKRCQQYGSDLFETRLMFHDVISMTGPEAAELFYDVHRFVRAKASPGRMQKTLTGQGGCRAR
jgi:fatty-acid peroxygenase